MGGLLVRVSGATAIGVVLKQLRRQRAMTQEQIAVEAGLDRTYVSYLETGRRSPSLDTMLALSTALHTPLAQIALLIEDRLNSDQ
ncbi:helix-turn-helix transcriptional regulator [Ralstonia solanacearum]|uniref:helix-turn-helix domain-containing protein n=1 Tax=Ralstonia solanacearum TaxID=305 RepID=UPI002F9527A1